MKRDYQMYLSDTCIKKGGIRRGERRRATDRIWSFDIYKIERSVIKPGQAIVYYLNGIKRGFVRKIPTLRFF